jgi:type I restriction enzyme S subunit
METVLENNKVDKYAEYKDSGIEWLGEIPSDWAKIKIKINSTIYNGDSLNENKKAKYESDDETHLAYISSKDIDLDTSIISYNNGLRIPRSEPKYKVAKSNSSLICIEGGSAGRKIAFTNQEVCFVNKLACVSAKDNINSKFLYYTLKGSLFQIQFKLAMSGMIGGVAISSINNFYILVPPLPEQAAIAAFLDRKTALIDQAIEIKQKQIELLKERRQILIHKAVTHGLNPNVKMKDSGVEWIGEIPEGWGIADLRRFTLEHRQGYYSESGYNESGHRVVRITDLLDDNIIDISESPYYSINEESRNRYELKIGDFLFQRTGSHKKIGVFNSLEPSIYASYLIRFRFNEKINHKFLLTFFNSEVFVNQINAQIHGGVNPNVHAENIKICRIIYPPIDEQMEIENYIKNASTKIATAISLKEQEIEKLKEYKATLINSAVTGKIKVC